MLHTIRHALISVPAHVFVSLLTLYSYYVQMISLYIDLCSYNLYIQYAQYVQHVYFSVYFMRWVIYESSISCAHSSLVLSSSPVEAAFRLVRPAGRRMPVMRINTEPSGGRRMKGGRGTDDLLCLTRVTAGSADLSGEASPEPLL